MEMYWITLQYSGVSRRWNLFMHCIWGFKPWGRRDDKRSIDVWFNILIRYSHNYTTQWKYLSWHITLINICELANQIVQINFVWNALIRLSKTARSNIYEPNKNWNIFSSLWIFVKAFFDDTTSMTNLLQLYFSFTKQ